MNIFEHLLPDEAILGIGPLMIEYHPDLTERSLYSTCRYFFDLHLPAHTTQIKSDWFQIRNEEEKEKLRQWKSRYFVIRSQIAEMIGEPVENPATF